MALAVGGYVVGLCVAAMIAVILLNHRFPGDVPVAVAALTGSAVGVLAVGRRVARLPEGDWRTLLFVGVVVAFWVLAVWAPQVAVAAVPAIYPLVFSTLPLRTALVVTTAINLIPLALVLLGQGVRSPNLRQLRCPCPCPTMDWRSAMASKPNPLWCNNLARHWRSLASTDQCGSRR